MEMKLWFTAAAAFAVASASLAQPPAPAALTNADVRPATAPVHETVFGHQLDDPYRWMEEPGRLTDVQAFIRAASAHTVPQLAALPGRAALRDRIAAGLNAGVRFGDVRQGGAALFYRRTDPGAQLAKLVVRGADGRERTLYDPEATTPRGGAIGTYSVSPDGRTVAVQTSGGGGEVGPIRFYDVATGREHPDRLEPVWGEFDAQWLDNQTVAYTKITATGSADQMQNMRVFLHRLGERGDGAALLGSGVDASPAFAPQEFPLVQAVETSDWVFGGGVGARADSRVFVARRADLLGGHPAWRVIGGYEDRLNGSALSGDTLYLYTTRQAPNGEVRALDLARGQSLADARVVMPASDLVISSLNAGTDGLYILGQTDGISRLFFLRNGANRPVEVRLPLRGNALLVQPADGGGVTFGMQDWFTAPRWFRARGTGVTPLGLDSASYAGLRGARQIRESATSADGTSVPMDILLPPGRRSGPLPLLLEGYGSYGINTAEPYYAQNVFGLLASGGAVAFCGTRGGGERGRAWHEAGRSANKPTAHADLIACGERLVQLGLTTPNRMTVMGTSAGGLLAPPAALRRPDLFGALISNVGIVNPTRLAQAENGANQFGEMGDPTTEAGFNALLSQDSYQMLATARDMPDTLLIVGLNDHRVAPWFSAKFAARALDRFGSSRLVLIRTDPEAGHGVGTARDRQIEQFADMWAFVLSQAGAPGFSRAR
jgi:prolyl oligopeptidase